MDILLSIHPKWAAKIYAGEKTYEYRKTFPVNFNAEKNIVYLYETSPIKKVTGFMRISPDSRNVLDCSECWPGELDPRKGCVELEELNDYWCKGTGLLYVWRITSATRTSLDIKSPKVIPQSWCYLHDEKFGQLDLFNK